MNKENVWLGVEQLTNDPEYVKTVNSEFASESSLAEQLVKNGQPSDRRDFLKYLGFGLGAATIAASCEIPIKRAIPYVVKPDEIVPGVATYYASTFVNGGDFCPVLVKTREGRPIKIEGNTLSSITKGGTSARAQASVLGLYDNNRYQGPAIEKNFFVMKKDDAETAWKNVDDAVAQKLTPNARIRLVSGTVLSPSTKAVVADFKKAFPNTTHVTYDAVSSSALIQANETTFGIKGIPSYHFDKADFIVSFNADFLGTWISPVEFATQYAINRKINKDLSAAKMSHHTQVESHMSLTGSNADNRIMVKPSEQGAAILALYNALAGKAGKEKLSGAILGGEETKKINKLADKLWESKTTCLVVSGSNNKSEQILINAINDLLDSYGNTITFSRTSLLRQGIDADIQNLVAEMNQGLVDVILFADGVNPAFDLPNRAAFISALSKVGLKISFSGIPNETSALCNMIAPTNHYLESWGDVEAYSGIYSLIQPTISPLFATRQMEESLLKWSGQSINVYEFLQQTWKSNLFSKQTVFGSFQAFWDQSLHDGVFELPASGSANPVFNADLSAIAGGITKPFKGEGLEISFFETVNMGGGQYANNPWLQELPDPITRCVWGNYLGIPLSWDGGNDFIALNGLNKREFYGEADRVDLTIGENTQRVTVVRQFGQLAGTVSLALGYGRTETGIQGLALGNQVGIAVQPWLSIDTEGNTQYFATNVQVSKAIDKEKDFACVQYHHSMGLKGIDPKSGETLNVDEKTAMTVGEGYQGGITERSIIYQSTLKEVKNLSQNIAHKRGEAEKLNQHTLYPYDEYRENYYEQGHHWKMHIDLNACIGCGACQVACIAENNVPVVGKYEVSRHHEMTWLRIDRYFYGDFENPNVVYQPMLCQHCDNAPCENVCPVAATNHSSEGLNQMTYNRCIGTRYCANNCPYKVRRFNWLDYTTADLFGGNEYPVNGEELPFGADNLTRMVLNPDVTVRSRGVIEKCSFCVQRIQEGKLTAKKEARKLNQNDVKTACQTACPTGAIVFGDANDKENVLNQRMEHPLNYLVLEETNTRSSVSYSAKVINRDESLNA
jgi:MoCo/4Fe-4S cofactor protein with predicted Tat translocation signal